MRFVHYNTSAIATAPVVVLMIAAMRLCSCRRLMARKATCSIVPLRARSEQYEKDRR